MAAKHKEWVASALTSLSFDGLFLPTEDRQNCEALIEEFFNDSDYNTGSEDEQVHFCACYNAQLAFFIAQNCCEYHEEYEQEHEQIDNEDTKGAHDIIYL